MRRERGRIAKRPSVNGAVGRIARAIVKPSGRVLALAGIVAATLVLLLAVQALSNGRRHGSRRSVVHVRGGSGRWSRLVWSDEFNGPSGASPSPEKWSFDTGGDGWDNRELESYTSRPANAMLDGHGQLVVVARAEKYTGADGITRGYTSARMQTLHEFQFKYGLVEARIKVPAGQGLIAQFWTLGDEAYESSGAWPASGEIDTMEVRGSDPHVVEGTIHGPWSWAPNGLGASSDSRVSLAAGFHVYGMEWTPNRIRFMLDGSVYETITPADLHAGAAWPFRHPFFLLLDLAVGGVWVGSPNSSTPFLAQLTVDWVRVWQ